MIFQNVKGNRVQIAQVLINLMRNAIEAIDSSNAKVRNIKIDVFEQSDRLVICVEDTGLGISKDAVLFKQFQTSKAEGMGLGLSICRKIVESNGGRLWTMLMFRQRHVFVSPCLLYDRRMSHLKTRSKVFLVDDEDEIRLMLSRALSKRGFLVETFACAQSFLDAYDSEQPGCLVLDYGMPELNGLELQQLINEQDILIPIIFISGHGGVRESVQAMKAGATDFLEKPFRQNTLVACIEAAFEKDMDARTEAKDQKAAQEKFGRLTTREQQIVSYMMDNPSHTASKEISRELKISLRTVDHHRARILEKMEIGSVTELMELSAFVNND